ncbi:uncharacterized protein K460DRAFT_354303 [Cucurbitaria berberidis CBS 394.84]|uniref:Secreted protein n=1 Tax=Cucurbitaria berberidis CBS 394.84 TaxID=1168544 RepID=A0A9P4GQH3_9PLEO|nr:uncharacterized protein K460DRAFT_354303 [Cucurbitaria berberidis CBS 394.84]KAF1849459.1 hypothetical protein K460DRAFT_354303 [Cucurbitaria berberidis CBS 394.84]
MSVLYLTLIAAQLYASCLSITATMSTFADPDILLKTWKKPAMSLAYKLAPLTALSHSLPNFKTNSSSMSTTLRTTHAAATSGHVCDKLPSLVEMPMGGMQCAVIYVCVS